MASATETGDLDWVCPQCRSHHCEMTAWVHVNTNEVCGGVGGGRTALASAMSGPSSVLGAAKALPRRLVEAPRSALRRCASNCVRVPG